MANTVPVTIVHYDRTDAGRIYLGDVGQRNQLGEGQGLSTRGQDRYISFGQDATLVQTGDVAMSQQAGRIKHFTDTTNFRTDTTFITL